MARTKYTVAQRQANRHRLYDAISEESPIAHWTRVRDVLAEDLKLPAYRRKLPNSASSDFINAEERILSLMRSELGVYTDD